MRRVGSRTNIFGASAWAVSAVLVMASQSSGAIVKCVPTGFGNSNNCCASVTTPACNASSASPIDPAANPNILVIVSDDQAYCQYGFMGGVCKTTGGALVSPWTDCRTDLDCPTGRVCMAHTNPTGSERLRLNDWSCRYRQAPTLASSCNPTNDEDVSADDGDDKYAWPFNASRYPCGGDGTSNPPTVPYAVARTPHIDRLAAQGYVFTRAHVSGNQCKSSRSSMSFGRHHRHNQWFTPGQDASCSPAGECDTSTHDPLAARLQEAAPDYKTFIYGKAEVFNVSGGGFEVGSVSSGPKAGKFNCTGTCADDLWAAITTSFPNIPPIARTANNNVVAGVIEPLRTNIFDASSGKQLQPFFLWFAPRMPHAGGKYWKPFISEPGKPRYEGFVEAELQQMGRVSRLDFTVGTVLDELEGTCVCTNKGNSTYAYESLFDHTVVIFLTDHGARQYYSKRNWTENTHRTPLIINHPSTRADPVDGSRVVRDELAHSIDLLPTILNLAGTGQKPGDLDQSPGSDAYDYGRDLWKWLDDGMTAPLRRAVYSEEAMPKGDYGEDNRPNRQVYIIPRAGEVGVCAAGTDKTISYLSQPHVRPCWPGDPDACGTGGACGIRGCSGGSGTECTNDGDCSGQTCRLRGRCANDPTLPCLVGEGNAQCVTTALCVSGKCKYDAMTGMTGRSLADRARPKASGVHTQTASCDASTPQTVAAACVPPGVELCQPLMLKVVAAGNRGLDSAEDPTAIIQAFDLNWDPDQRSDLTSKGTIPYLARPRSLSEEQTNKLDSRLLACLQKFWHDETSGGGEHWQRPASWGNCPFAEPIAQTP